MVDDRKTLSVLKRLAARDMSGSSGAIPLRDLDGNDISLDGRFWIEFREAGAAEKDKLYAAGLRERVERSGDVEREFSRARVMDVLVESNLVRGGNLPCEDEKNPDGIGDIAWPKNQGDQRRLVRAPANTHSKAITFELMLIIVDMAMRFYGEGEEEVEELGNSLETSESQENETEVATL